MNAARGYLEYLETCLKTAMETQTEQLNQAAAIAADCLEQGHRIYAFGSGHSAMVAEEIFGRAGGIAAVKAIVPDEVWAHNLPRKSTYLERVEGYAKALCTLYRIGEGDVLLVVSNSGRNPLPVEMALCAREVHAKVVVITSLAHSSSVSSRHSSGKRLFELADVVLDNGAAAGDAGYYVDGCSIPVGPTSSAIGIALAQAWIARTVQILCEREIEPEIFKSSNLDHADEWNDMLFDKYHNYWK